MALDTYPNLKQAIKDHLDRGSELDGFLDDFIDLAEARIRREVRMRTMLSQTTLTLSDGARTVALPSDFLDDKYLRVIHPVTGSIHRYLPPLEYVEPDQMARISTNCERDPRAYMIRDVIEVDAEADQDYSIEFLYYVNLTSLDDSNTSNVVLAFAPDLYLYGSLAASAPVLRDDERVTLWNSFYVDGRDSVNGQQIRSTRGSPQVSRVRGPTP